MGHEIVSFAGAAKILLQFRQRWRDCRLVDLSGRKALAFIPFPDGLAVEAAEEAGKSVPDAFYSENEFGPKTLEYLAGFSRDGPFAWIRTDYFGGAGYQAAILWADGAPVFGPDVMWAKDDSSRPSTDWPINRALRGLGVQRDGNNDEFLMFGFGRYRSCEDIEAEAADFPV
jgi:hypothetical protein